MIKIKTFLLLACLLGLSLTASLRNLGTHEHLSYPLKMGDRPTSRRYESDDDYNRWCTPQTSKIKTLISLDVQSHLSLNCGEDTAVGNQWKDIIFCGRMNAYDHNDVGRVWNKVVHNFEEADIDINTISCASAATLSITGFYPCPSYHTTADLIFAHNEEEDLGMTSSEILEMAESQVAKRVANFVAERDCGAEYHPSTMKNTKVSEKKFHFDSSLTYEVDAEHKAIGELAKLVEFTLESLKNDGTEVNGTLKYEGTKEFNWEFDEEYNVFFVKYVDIKLNVTYEMVVTPEFNHGLFWLSGDFDTTIRWSTEKLCPESWPEDENDSEDWKLLKHYYSLHPITEYNSHCEYRTSPGPYFEYFYYSPISFTAIYQKRTENSNKRWRFGESNN